MNEEESKLFAEAVTDLAKQGKLAPITASEADTIRERLDGIVKRSIELFSQLSQLSNTVAKLSSRLSDLEDLPRQVRDVQKAVNELKLDRTGDRQG